MANWSDLKAAVAQVIKTNGNNEITGQILQNVLNNIISNVGENATLAGIATPTTNPGAPDGNVFYFATQAGTYTNFGSVELNNGLNILHWNGTSWAVTNVMNIVQELGTSETAVMSQKAISTLSSFIQTKSYHIDAGGFTQDVTAFVIPANKTVYVYVETEAEFNMNNFSYATSVYNWNYIALNTFVKINFENVETTFGINVDNDVCICTKAGDVTFRVYSGAYADIIDSYINVSNKFDNLKEKIGIFSFTDNTIIGDNSITTGDVFNFLYILHPLNGTIKRLSIKQNTTYQFPTEINHFLGVHVDNYDADYDVYHELTYVDILDANDEDFYPLVMTNSQGSPIFIDNNILQIYVNNKFADVKNKFNSILSNITDTKSEQRLVGNTYALIGIDGKIKHANSADNVVSDFIPIGNIPIKRIVACFDNTNHEQLAVAFYESNSEDTFISGTREYMQDSVYSWKIYDGLPNIPYNAKYMRISGNTESFVDTTGLTPYYEYGYITKKNYSNAPSNNIEYFTYDVDTAKEDVEDANKGTSVIDVSSISKDNAVIRLPETYTADGKPTRLIIFNHGAGGQVGTNGAENINSSCVLLLQKKGYAIIEVNGVPENMRNTAFMSASYNGAAAHMGGWVFMRSVLAAYKYVTEKYNLAKDGCFVIGKSMGGVTTLNMAMLGVLPIKAIALDAPIIDSFHDAYFSGGWSAGDDGGNTPQIFAWIFQWDYCNFTDKTYTIPQGNYNIFGQQYNVASNTTKNLTELSNNNQDRAILWHLNENKMTGYNAYKTGDFLVKNLDKSHVYDLSTDNDENYFGKKLPCPCKIWFGNGDATNQIEIAQRFVKKARNGGSIIMLRTCPTTRHCVWNETSTLPDNTDIGIMEDGIRCSPYAVELWNWLKRWDGEI